MDPADTAKPKASADGIAWIDIAARKATAVRVVTRRLKTARITRVR
jgi:hypothetical protein